MAEGARGFQLPPKVSLCPTRVITAEEVQRQLRLALAQAAAGVPVTRGRSGADDSARRLGTETRSYVGPSRALPPRFTFRQEELQMNWSQFPKARDAAVRLHAQVDTPKVNEAEISSFIEKMQGKVDQAVQQALERAKSQLYQQVLSGEVTADAVLPDVEVRFVAQHDALSGFLPGATVEKGYGEANVQVRFVR